ncbi:MAG: serine acetyltransferase [Anaerolineae bacterium]|nr:serine acetyltransferase [Anaerolineae bacterium]
MRLGRGFYLVLYRLVEITTGISLNPLAEIGPGLYIGHFGEIIIGGQVRMGSNCNISQGVTIGGGGRSERHSPEIGNRVYIAPGAKVFGPITIGDDVAIGANAVVTESFPARSVVGGVPAKLISEQGSFDFVNYAHMETDPDRQPSLPQ